MAPQSLCPKRWKFPYQEGDKPTVKFWFEQFDVLKLANTWPRNLIETNK